MKTSLVILLIALIAIAVIGSTEALFGRKSLKDECLSKCDKYVKKKNYFEICKKDCYKFFTAEDLKRCKIPCQKYAVGSERKECEYKCATNQPFSESFATESCDYCFSKGCRCYKDRATGWASCRC